MASSNSPPPSYKGPFTNDIGVLTEEGSGSITDNSTDGLREWDSKKGGGGPKIPNISDVICERPLTMFVCVNAAPSLTSNSLVSLLLPK